MVYILINDGITLNKIWYNFINYTITYGITFLISYTVNGIPGRRGDHYVYH